MLNRLQTRVPHLRDSPIVANVGFVCGLGVLLAWATGVAHAQSCQQLGIRRSSKLTYPQIAKGAHVSGLVTLVATFGTDGTFSSINAMQGPAMFLPTARSYVESWQVNSAASSQTCEITVDFRWKDQSSCQDRTDAVTMSDTQHFAVTTSSPCIDITNIDPAYTKHHFLFMHWRSQNFK